MANPYAIRQAIQRIRMVYDEDRRRREALTGEQGASDGWKVFQQSINAATIELGDRFMPERAFAEQFFPVDERYWPALLGWLARRGIIWRRQPKGVALVYAYRPDSLGSGRGRIAAPASDDALIADVACRIAPALAALADAIDEDSWEGQQEASGRAKAAVERCMRRGVAIGAVRRSLRFCDPVVMQRLAFHEPLFDPRSDDVEAIEIKAKPRAKARAALPERVMAAIDRGHVDGRTLCFSELRDATKASKVELKRELASLTHKGLLTAAETWRQYPRYRKRVEVYARRAFIAEAA